VLKAEEPGHRLAAANGLEGWVRLLEMAVAEPGQEEHSRAEGSPRRHNHRLACCSRRHRCHLQPILVRSHRLEPVLAVVPVPV